MNIKRFIFWLSFIVIIGLIIWGLIVAMNKPASDGSFGTPAPITADDHVLGPDDAKVTLIEYGDFQCPACAAYAPLVDRLFMESATGTLRVVFRHYPLPQHKNAIAAAQAVEAASQQGKFWEMYRLIYSNLTTWQDDAPDIARAEFEGYAVQLGLDKEKFILDRDSDSTMKAIQDDKAEAQSLALAYTPTFFVNGKAISNPPGYEAFKAIIDAAAK